MNTPFRWAVAVAMLIVVTGPPMSSAAPLTDAPSAPDESLKLIPANAPIVVQVNGFEKSRNKLGKFLGNALPDVAPKLVKEIDEGIADLAKGRDLKTISKDGRLYTVVTSLEDLAENPQFAFLIPVTDYKKFKGGFFTEDERKSLKDQGDGVDSVPVNGKDLFMSSRKDYVIVSPDKEVVKSLAKSDGKTLTDVLSKETAHGLLAQDAGIYVNLKEINKQYGAQIQMFKPLIEGVLQNAGMGIDKKQIEMFKQLVNAFVALLDDGVAAVFGFEFRPEGVNVHFLAQFAGDSPTNDFLKKMKPAPLNEIGTLPAGQLMFSASNFDPAASKTIASIIQASLADDENEEAREFIKRRYKELAGNGRAFELTAMKNSSANMIVSEYKDGPKAVAAQLAIFKALTSSGTFSNTPLKDKPEIKENAEKVGGYSLNSVKLTFDIDKAVEKLPAETREATKAALKQTLGGDSTTIWFGNSGNKVIQVTGKDFKSAKEMIESYLAGRETIGKNELFEATRKQLPANATILVLGDTAKMIEMLFAMLKEQLGALPAGAIPGLPGGAFPDLKAPKGKAAYFGVAAVFKPEYVTFDLFVPVPAVQQVRKMFDGDN